jgi:CO dehydrogenase maturation factor
MSHFIAITGKGGVGKTTISALIVNRLIKRGRTPVLAIDADPNTCLDALLGVKVEKTVGRVREEARDIAGKGMAAGASKQELLEMKIAESLVEADNFDLIAMGRSEGPGCYCYANNVLKSVIREISGNYPYIVLDNEAGLENLSRRIVQEVDVLIIASDPSNRGVETVKRLYELSEEMGIRYKKLVLILNRIRNGNMPDSASELKQAIHADILIHLPDNIEIIELSESGKVIAGLKDDNPVVTKIDELLDKLEL